MLGKLKNGTLNVTSDEYIVPASFKVSIAVPKSMAVFGFWTYGK
jgi:hypothetical protein